MIHDPGKQLDIANDIMTTIRLIERLKLFCPHPNPLVIITSWTCDEAVRVIWRWNMAEGKEMQLGRIFTLKELELIVDGDHFVTKVLYDCQSKMEKST